MLAVTGEIDIATAPLLRDRLDKAIEGERSLMIVDLSSVTFLDSTGPGVLIGASKRIYEAGGSMNLVVVEPRILKLLGITGLTANGTEGRLALRFGWDDDEVEVSCIYH